MTSKYAFDREDDSTLYDTIVSSFERLNVSIEDATNMKKILTSRLDRTISLKKEVELNEKAAEEAKEEAATSHLVILAKVEALKQAQLLAKGINETHAREVYEQRVVLAKEIKELQLRVSGVLNKGRLSLEVSDEMHRLLKRRLTKAFKEKELEDKDRLEKETLAKEALALEETQMLKLEKESNRLKQETIKNSKLQDIFKERESVVNILRGDISHKYQDINLFIERLDQPVQRQSRLLSSTQPLADLVQEERKVNMNGLFEVKSEPVVANITEVGHSVSTDGQVASDQTYVECVDAPICLKDYPKRVKGGESGNSIPSYIPPPIISPPFPFQTYPLYSLHSHSFHTRTHSQTHNSQSLPVVYTASKQTPVHLPAHHPPPMQHKAEKPQSNPCEPEVHSVRFKGKKAKKNKKGRASIAGSERSASTIAIHI